MSDRTYLRSCGKCHEYHRTTKITGKFLCSFCKGKSSYPRVYYKNRRIALVRDNYTCQCCGTKNDINVHHIDCDKTNNSPSNLITLCDQCHHSLHGKYTHKELREANIYKLFPKKFRWGIFGKRPDNGVDYVNKTLHSPPKKFAGAKVTKMKSKQIFGPSLYRLSRIAKQ